MSSIPPAIPHAYTRCGLHQTEGVKVAIPICNARPYPVSEWLLRALTLLFGFGTPGSGRGRAVSELRSSGVSAPRDVHTRSELQRTSSGPGGG